MNEGRIGIAVGAAMLLVVVVAGIAVPLLSEFHPNELVAIPFQPPSREYFFGTDQLGRDVFTRVFAAVHRDLGVAFLGVSIPLVLGTAIGILLSLAPGRVVAALTTSLIDAINALPLLVLAIALIALFGPGLQSIVIILAMTNWARYARIARTRADVVARMPYIEAARLQGYPRHRILLRHFVPNVSAETLAYAAEWGVMMSEGRPFVQNAWWMTIFPGLAVCWAGIGLSFIAEGLSRRERGAGE